MARLFHGLHCPCCDPVVAKRREVIRAGLTGLVALAALPAAAQAQAGYDLAAKQRMAALGATVGGGSSAAERAASPLRGLRVSAPRYDGAPGGNGYFPSPAGSPALS